MKGCVVEVFATADAASRYAALRGDTTWTLVDDRALASLSDSVTPAGVVAVCRALDRPASHVLDGSSLAVIGVDVRDPGNAGTLIRCADAAGGDAVVLAGTSVDPHNPKTVRASVGSVFHVPIAMELDAAASIKVARGEGLRILATDAAGEVDLDRADDLIAGPVAWVFGNEASGLPDELLAMADHRVSIPIHGRAESLNLATAAAVCLYASARARRR